jgi:hypothetical protein
MRPDLFDTSSVPDDAEYWDRRAALVVRSAIREPERGSLDWLTSSPAIWVTVTSLFVLAFGIVLKSSAQQPADPRPSTDWVSSVAPTDDIGKALVTSDAPPQIGALLADGRPSSVR